MLLKYEMEAGPDPDFEKHSSTRKKRFVSVLAFLFN